MKNLNFANLIIEKKGSLQVSFYMTLQNFDQPRLDHVIIAAFAGLWYGHGLFKYFLEIVR